MEVGVRPWPYTMVPNPISCPWQSKRIVGRIIPAIATSTAAVAGLVGLELYKVVGGPRPLSAFRHSYLHLAENYFSRYMPVAPATQKVSPDTPLTPSLGFPCSFPNRPYSGFWLAPRPRFWGSP